MSFYHIAPLILTLFYKKTTKILSYIMAEDENNSNNGLVGSSFSLVRYNNPVLIDKKQDAVVPGGSGAGGGGLGAGSTLLGSAAASPVPGSKPAGSLVRPGSATVVGGEN